MRLTLRKCQDMGDWYVIERADHSGDSGFKNNGDHFAFWSAARFSDNADVEGDASEMLAIAAGIKAREPVAFKRCAVRFDGTRVMFRSPRNSQRDGECSLAEADELADLIIATVKEKRHG